MYWRWPSGRLANLRSLQPDHPPTQDASSPLVRQFLAPFATLQPTTSFTVLGEEALVAMTGEHRGPHMRTLAAHAGASSLQGEGTHPPNHPPDRLTTRPTAPFCIPVPVPPALRGLGHQPPPPTPPFIAHRHQPHPARLTPPPPSIPFLTYPPTTASHLHLHPPTPPPPFPPPPPPPRTHAPRPEAACGAAGRREPLRAGARPQTGPGGLPGALALVVRMGPACLPACLGPSGVLLRLGGVGLRAGLPAHPGGRGGGSRAQGIALGVSAASA